jgi:N-acetyl sugar amidotransferase
MDSYYKETEPFLENIHYCTRCCMPASNEGVSFDELGICSACNSAEHKIHINWSDREKKLKALLDEQKEKNKDEPYDCMIPISGGKDSTFQLYLLTQVYGMRPLAVTFSHNWFDEVGRYNLENSLEKFDVDHIMFTPKRSLVNRLARKSLTSIGDACWHCHAGVGAFPMQIAVKYNIQMLIWGESAAETSGRATHFSPKTVFDRDYFTKISAKKTPEEMVCEDISLRELAPFQQPEIEEIEKRCVFGIHLGDYIFWDDERQTEFVRDIYGWKERYVEGAYKRYKSVECKMAGVHDYTKFIKRGFGRGTDQASADVRAGLMTREEGLMIAQKIDAEEPGALEYYLSITGYSRQEFYEILGEHRTKLNIKGLSDKDFNHALRKIKVVIDSGNEEKVND